ncbi:Ger(x)C family spore germination protein [Niallia endozanthoxylica]|uniref:Ger(X)C family spore germination protein n=1 Tax=Niallia endozanthoxylica TaxID=2036016 RepID=A0A5J5I0S7_9BACI|nr:Ger(x)C family spore germination protein [Niallia endozanthoxylica]KAA9028543.1 Ger(x)C family spore germination protein [Niallia endozanthoxylica]
MIRFVFVFLSILLLSGCWDRKELKEIGIVGAIAIDKDPETGEFILTSEILNPAAQSSQNPSPGKPFLLETTTGKTIFEALRKTNQMVDRKSFYAHNKVIIVSEELAREGLISVLDSFYRGKEIRGYVWICITKETSARKILEAENVGVSRIPANFLKNVFEQTASHLNSVSTNMLTFYKDALEAGTNPVAGVLLLEEKDKDKHSQKSNIRLSGAAMFKKDKLIDFLNESETRGYRWITGDIKTGAISLPTDLQEGKFVSVDVVSMNAKIVPDVKGEQISFSIHITEEGKVTEQQATVKFNDSKQQIRFLEALEEENKKVMEEEIKQVIEKAQAFQTDIFGFGSALNKKYPEIWNQVKDEWPERFADVTYSLHVKVNITSSGLMKGPFKPE